MKPFKRYRIGSRIGEHLMVVSVLAKTRDRHPVYLAWDSRSWCPVVCKVFRDSSRAQQEYDVLNRVAHPNIVRALGTYEPAIMLMDHLEGPTLREFAKRHHRGRLNVSDAIRAALHIGSALENAHRRGVLHLDVKPSNVIEVNGRPVLFDFGTARLIGDRRPPVVQGTDAYMSPEECALSEVSPASDVFSLGVTLFELLAGDLPFSSCNSIEPYPQLRHEPRQLRQLRRGVSSALNRLLIKCLATDPMSRPPLNELLPELDGLIQSGQKMLPDFVNLGKPLTTYSLANQLQQSPA